jgi:hypothetical protein
MKFTPSQQMQMVALMHRKSQQVTTPENRKKLTELVEAHRKIAKIRAGKAKRAEVGAAVRRRRDLSACPALLQGRRGPFRQWGR